jgi:hypothetical protein
MRNAFRHGRKYRPVVSQAAQRMLARVHPLAGATR